jgi:uncharacterized sulfatase
MTGRTLDRRGFLGACSAGFAGMAFPGLIQSKKEKRPNILWIISEDTSPDMACYGTPLVQTPNIDRLAAEGVRFENAFATCPVCSPSRSAFNTGMVQTSIGAHQHRTRDKKLLPHPVRIVTDYFRDAGYFTTNCAGLRWNKAGKTDWNFKVDHAAFDGTDWKDRMHGQPFFAQVNLFMTHRAFQRDPENPIDPEAVTIPPYYPDHPITRRDWADYLESIQVLDRQIGQVLKRLDEEGLTENTVVFYFGDHGRPHVRGKQWLYEGGIRVPLIVRDPRRTAAGRVSEDLVSLIDLVPTSLALAGVRKPAFMQGKVFQGRIREKGDAIFAARDRCDGTVDRIRAIRTSRFKYMRNFMPERPYTQFNAYKLNSYPVLTLLEVLHARGELTEAQAQFMAERRPAEELYDLEKDPHEIHNLAGDPEHASTRKELRRRLRDWIRETDDQGETPEDPQVVADEARRMQDAHERRAQRRGLAPDASALERLQVWERQLLSKEKEES